MATAQEPPVVILLVFNEKEIETIDLAVEQCCSLSFGPKRIKANEQPEGELLFTPIPMHLTRCISLSRPGRCHQNLPGDEGH